jgi:hypothetical protein
VEEVAPGSLVALGGAKKAQLYVSKDEGKNWTPFGEPLPFGGRGFTYDGVRKSFFACAEKGSEGAVARWDVKDLDAAFGAVTSDVTVWDGEGFADGNGWSAPQDKCSFKQVSTEHYNGKNSLEYHVSGVASSSAGWNWANWQSGAMTDVAGFESLSFYIKVTGDKPEKVQVNINNGPDKGGATSETVDVAKYAPDFMDGQWHQVVVPLKDLQGASKFNAKNTYEIRLITNQAKESTVNIYVDVVKFIKGSK